MSLFDVCKIVLDFSTAHDLFGQYATDVYTNEAVKVGVRATDDI